MNLRRVLRHLTFAEAHHRHAIALGVAALAFGLAWREGLAKIVIAWDGYALALIFLAWLRILTASPAAVLRVASLQHFHRMLLLGFVLLAACMSLAAVVFLLFSKSHHEPGTSGLAFLAAGTVGLSWVLVHTIFTLEYAYLFYRLPDSRRIDPRPHGLEFPGKGDPDYLDFAYFAFVIGMTSQTSDVQIVSRRIRRWTLLHGLIAFVFNTAVLAMSINVIAGLF